MQQIRNFSIIAHVDHGKSTLADRIIQLCGGLEAREMEAQVLDSNPIERERGITIKAQSVSLPYKAKDGQTYFAQLHRHPGPRRLQLRGQPLAGRVRRRVAGRGRRAGRGGAVGRQLLHRSGAGPGSRAGAQQDRPARRPTSTRAKAEIEAVIGIDAEDAVAISAKTGLERRRRAGGHRPPHPAAEAARHRQAAGADHRLVVRQLPAAWSRWCA